MDYSLQIQKLLVKKDAVKEPNDKIKILKEAIALADAHNDIEWSYDLRLDIMDEEYYTSRYTERFAAFTWLLNACDENPDLFDEDDLLWRYRWMVHAARMTVNISLEQIEQINNDFKARLQRCGYGLRAFYNDEFRRYYIQNSMDRAKECLDLREKEQVNDMVCEACEISEWIDYNLRFDELDKALALYNELIAKGYSCMRRPFDTYCSFVDYYTRKGNIEKAHEMYLKTEELFNDPDCDHLTVVGSMSILINFLSHYNPNKAWELVERSIENTVEATDENKYKFSRNILHLLSDGGNRVVNIPTTVPWYRTDNTYNLSELYDYYYNIASDLAQRFDARNGNNIFMSLVEKLK